MISINNLSVQFSGTPLFDHVSFIINDKDRIGLVGKNGAGKSTLLRIINSLQKPDEGDVIIPSGDTIGYLQQEIISGSTKTVVEEAMTAFYEIMEIKEKIASLEHEIKSRTDFDSEEYHDLIRKHSECYERFNLLEGSSIQTNTEKVLTGLGFEIKEFSLPMNHFSSGWQMRVELAKILLRVPDVILLDEPTNHLDIESIQWLEEYLINYKGAVVLVSHDRAFLDNVTKRTIEISMGKIFDYRANYSGYIALREERLDSQIATYNNQQRQIRQIERFVERFRYKATKAAQVQSRIKMLEKIDEIELDVFDDSSITFRFPKAPHSGKIVLEAKHLVKDYPQKRVLNDLNFSVIKNDRIAFVGKNGEGKTTLSKVIVKQTPHTGELKYGHNVVIGYYAQDQSDFLDPDRTVFQTIDDIATGDIRPKIRTILGGFLFSGDTIDKKVKVLSGGEKSRLSLAKLLLVPSNLLILDEPTNHLDMHSKDILKNALIRYDGTLIVVSHDRDFLRGLTNRVFEFKKGTIKEYLGDIYDFLDARRIQTLSQLETAEKTEEPTKKSSYNKEMWTRRKDFEKEIRKIQNQITKSESEIEMLENEIGKTEEMLIQPEKFKDKVIGGQLFNDYEKWKSLLEKEMKKWEDLNMQKEELEKKDPDLEIQTNG
ncbi:MAG: ATP-binding cassette domain-containing protein [Bacteroidales bacterium]|jgi:ATP-binding cassette subfamily F protein 3